MNQKPLFTKFFHDKEGKRIAVKFFAPGIGEPTLISYPSQAEMLAARLTRGYTGKYDMAALTEAEVDGFMADIQRTKLQTPLEMLYTVWLLRDVSRAFTHQIVRYRVGTSFIQESMRFLGAHGEYRVLQTNAKSQSAEALSTYRTSATEAVMAYHNMVLDGVPSQDARGVLPTNILTHLYFGCSLRTLQAIIPQRLCCQAQPGEWQILLRRMRLSIAGAMGLGVESLLRAPYERGEDCGYRASFDRPCIWVNGQAE